MSLLQGKESLESVSLLQVLLLNEKVIVENSMKYCCFAPEVVIETGDSVVNCCSGIGVVGSSKTFI